MENALSFFSDISGFVFDVDGIFTDGSMLITENGEMLRSMNTRDGFALKLLLQAGMDVCIITGGESEGVRHRFEKLGVKDIFMGIGDKLTVLEMWVDRSGADMKKLCYVGDDLPDYAAMKAVGFACCPSDADPQVKSICHYISPCGGGNGCARDIIEKCLRAQDKWPRY